MKLDADGTKRVNKPIEQANKEIQSVITSMNGKELEIINVMRTWNNEVKKHNFFSMYDNECEGKTSRISEKREK